MNEALRKRMSVSEFLLWAEERPGDQRYELVNGIPVAMAAQRADHIDVKVAAATALKSSIRRAGVRCFSLGDGMTVPVDEHSAYEPDALVYCGEKIAGDSIVMREPVVIIEVVSPSTRHVDAGLKLTGYFKLSSVSHYLILDPERRLVVHHRRGAERVITTTIVGEGSLSLDPPGLEVPTADFFAEL